MPIQLNVVSAIAAEPSKSAGAFIMPVNTCVMPDNDGEQWVHIMFKAADLDGCRKSSVKVDSEGKKTGGNYGFMIPPQVLGCLDAEWDVVLRPGWVTLGVVPKGAQV